MRVTWGRPGNARKWHIFEDSRSLCGSWFLRGTDDAVSLPAKERKTDCVKCVRAANRRLA